MIKHLEESELKEELENENKLVIVDFFANWCGPCQMLAPVLEEIAEERKDIVIYKVDIDHSPNLGYEYRVEVVPTMILFKNKEVIGRLEGYYTTSELIGEIEKYL